LGAKKLTLFAGELTLEWITTLDAAEFAGPASEGLCSISNPLAGRKRRVPLSKDVILAIGPGAFTDKRDRVSTDLTYVWAVRGLDVEWIVLGNDPIRNAVTERMSSNLLRFLDPLKGGLKLPDLAICSAANVGVVSATVAINNERTNMAVSSLLMVSFHEHACASRTPSVALRTRMKVQGVQPADGHNSCH
jgi:hypothetical protein